MFLGDQRTIEKLVERKNQILKDISNLEKVLVEKKRQVDKLDRILKLNIEVANSEKEFAWAEEQISFIE